VNNTSDEQRTEEITRDQTEQAIREGEAHNDAKAADAATRQRTDEGRHQHGWPRRTEVTLRTERKADSGQ
jgi:hypothetical protein